MLLILWAPGVSQVLPLEIDPAPHSSPTAGAQGTAAWAGRRSRSGACAVPKGSPGRHGRSRRPLRVPRGRRRESRARSDPRRDRSVGALSLVWSFLSFVSIAGDAAVVGPATARGRARRDARLGEEPPHQRRVLDPGRLFYPAGHIDPPGARFPSGPSATFSGSMPPATRTGVPSLTSRARCHREGHSRAAEPAARARIQQDYVGFLAGLGDRLLDLTGRRLLGIHRHRLDDEERSLPVADGSL